MVLRELQFGRDLPECRCAAQLGSEACPRLSGQQELLVGPDRQPDRVGGPGDAALDALADPPRGVRRELEAFAPLELGDGADQSEVAVLDQIVQRDTRRLGISWRS